MRLAGSATQKPESLELGDDCERTNHPDNGQRRNSLPSVIRMNETAKGDDCARKPRQPVIWFEVEDFLRYFDHFPNPTGVQRVSFELYRAAKTLYGLSERVRFCRLSVYSKRLHAIGFDAIRSAYLNPPGSNAPWKTFWEPAVFWEKFPRTIPVVMRHPVFSFQSSRLPPAILSKHGSSRIGLGSPCSVVI